MGVYSKEDIIRIVREEEIEFVRLQFTDIFGMLKNVAITASQIEKAVSNQCMFDGSSIEGFVRIDESDQYLYPDLKSFRIFPWRPSHGKVARLICDVYNTDGTPFVGDPRYVLKRVIQKANDMGYDRFNVGPEAEFFLFKTDEEGKPFPDNDERAIFFARGVLETVKKLRWTPTVVHCHGWFSSIVPIYLKKVFADDPIFKEVKIVVSLYGDGFDKPLDAGMKEKIANEGVKDKKLSILDTPSYENLCRYVMEYADGIILASDAVTPEIIELVRNSGKPLLEYQSPDAEDFFDNYNRFYDSIQ